MALGIVKTLEVIEDLGSIAQIAIKIAKEGLSFGSIGNLLQIAKDVNELIKDVPGALPELSDLDSVEAAKIGEAAYGLVKKVVDAIKAPKS